MKRQNCSFCSNATFAVVNGEHICSSVDGNKCFCDSSDFAADADDIDLDGTDIS